MSEIEILNMHNAPLVADLCFRIDRKTKWGNPFKMRSERERMHVIRKYAYYILDSKLLDDLHEIKGKWLACWCHPKPCHGNVLKYLAEHRMHFTKDTKLDQDLIESIKELSTVKSELTFNAHLEK